MDICVLRVRQGRIQTFSYVGQNSLVFTTKYSESQQTTEAEVGHFLYFDCNVSKQGRR